MTRRTSPDELPRIYCAGPLFNQSERNEMAAIAEALNSAGFPVFLPHRDGMEFRKVHHVLVRRGLPAEEAGAVVHAAIFALDVYQLAVECGGMVWNLNGRVPDEGAVSEAAIAWTLGKPLVAYCDDARSLIAGRQNPLLAGLVNFVVEKSIDNLPAAMRNRVASQPQRDVDPKSLPPRLQHAVKTGRQLWRVMQTEKSQGNDERIAEIVTELFG